MNQSNFTGDVRGTIPLRCLLLHPGLITKATLTVAYVALLIVACVENTLVIYLVRTCKDLRQCTFNYLIINMAVADMMDVCFATITSITFTFVGNNWIPGFAGKISCKLVYFILCMSISLSISTLVIMSVDRYMAIVHVMKKPMSSSGTKKCIALSWIVSVIVGSPYLYKMDTRERVDGSTICLSLWSKDPEKHLFYSTVEECGKALIFYVLPLIVIGTTSTVIGLSLRKRRPLGNSETQERINVQNQKIYKLLVATVLLFAFCWLFAHVNHLMGVFYLPKFCALPAPVPLFFFWISHVNAAINPIIYFIFNNNFQHGLKEALRGRETRPLQKRNVVSQENFAFESLEIEHITTEAVSRSVNQEDIQQDTALEFDTKL